jgi:hypothetical protein
MRKLIMVFFALSCATGVVGAFMKVKHMAGASAVLVISIVATLFFYSLLSLGLFKLLKK